MEWLIDQKSFQEKNIRRKGKKDKLETTLNEFAAIEARKVGRGVRLFVQACVLTGCDYSPNQLSGVGLVTAFNEVRRNSSCAPELLFKRILKKLPDKATENINVTKYEELLCQSEAVFYYHPVRDPSSTLRVNESLLMQPTNNSDDNSCDDDALEDSGASEYYPSLESFTDLSFLGAIGDNDHPKSIGLTTSRFFPAEKSETPHNHRRTQDRASLEKERNFTVEITARQGSKRDRYDRDKENNAALTVKSPSMRDRSRECDPVEEEENDIVRPKKQKHAGLCKNACLENDEKPLPLLEITVRQRKSRPKDGGPAKNPYKSSSKTTKPTEIKSTNENYRVMSYNDYANAEDVRGAKLSFPRIPQHSDSSQQQTSHPIQRIASGPQSGSDQHIQPIKNGSSIERSNDSSVERDTNVLIQKNACRESLEPSRSKYFSPSNKRKDPRRVTLESPDQLLPHKDSCSDEKSPIIDLTSSFEELETPSHARGDRSNGFDYGSPEVGYCVMPPNKSDSDDEDDCASLDPQCSPSKKNHMGQNNIFRPNISASQSSQPRSTPTSLKKSPGSNQTLLTNYLKGGVGKPKKNEPVLHRRAPRKRNTLHAYFGARQT